jgi:hypothetical protein
LPSIIQAQALDTDTEDEPAVLVGQDVGNLLINVSVVRNLDGNLTGKVNLIWPVTQGAALRGFLVTGVPINVVAS